MSRSGKPRRGEGRIRKAREQEPAKRGGGQGPRRGRSRLDPNKLEPKLTEYLNLAERQGADAYPLDHKSIAAWLGCSHTHLSPKAIEETPPEFRTVWRDFIERIEQAKRRADRGRRNLVDKQKDRVESLQAEIKRLEREKESLWIWMLHIEAGLQDSGVNVEMFVPDDLRHLRQRRLEELPFD